MTPRKQDGHGAKRVALDMQDVAIQNERLLETAIADLLDGDNDTAAAQRALNQIRTNNFGIFAVQGAIASGELSRAEDLSESVAGGKGVQKGK